MITPTKIHGLTPFVCSYTRDGKRYGITLYGESAEQVLNANCDALDGLTVDGVLEGIIHCDGKETGHE